MGIYDRDYMREPDPPRRPIGSIILVVLFLTVLLTIAFLRQRPALRRSLVTGFSNLIQKSK